MLIYTLIVDKMFGEDSFRKFPDLEVLQGNPEQICVYRKFADCVCCACSPFMNKEKLTIGCVDFAYLRKNQQPRRSA